MTDQEFASYLKQNTGIIIRIARTYTNNVEDERDLIQEIYYQIWKSKEQFKGQSKWTTWIYKIALFTALGTLRKSKRKKVISEFETEAFEIDLDFDQENKIQHLQNTIRKLDELDRAIVLLYLEEKSYDEIAEIIGITVNNVGVKLNRIRDKLRKLWNSKN